MQSPIMITSAAWMAINASYSGIAVILYIESQVIPALRGYSVIANLTGTRDERPELRGDISHRREIKGFASSAIV